MKPDNRLKNFQCLVPVSYTHLDVYKRQILLIVASMVGVSLIRFQQRTGEGEPRPYFGNRKLEIIWTVGPILIIIWLFVLTARGMRQSDPPANRQPDLIVIGHQWWWEVRYPQTVVVTANEIHIPVGQALAIRVDGDRASFRNCRFLGWQDTILLNRGRQYFENCDIAGAVDFIFGAATAWFEKCHIHCLGNGYITAASTPVDEPFGLVFSDCYITGAKPAVQTFLGRPWRIYAATIFLNTEMSGVVRPEGWNDWKKPETHTTARYAEFGNTGPGASPTNRPGWIKQLTGAEAQKITVEKVLGGTDGWNPALKPQKRSVKMPEITRQTKPYL